MGYLDNDLYPVLPNVANLQLNSGACALHRERGYLAYKTVDINGTAGAASIDLFNVIGVVELMAIWGKFTDVTEVTAITAASFDFDDGAATVPITAAAGTALSGATLNSTFFKAGGAAVALAFANASQVRYNENAAGARAFDGGLLTCKSATTCQIRLTVTTDANTNATVQVWCAWVCRYPSSSLAAV